ncbi:MAG: hypothetical protein ACRCXL_13945 [Dermatophilaceae bacterium]
MRALHRVLSTVAILAAVVALTACGVSAAPKAPDPVVDTAPDAAVSVSPDRRISDPKVGDTVSFAALVTTSNTAILANKSVRVRANFAGSTPMTYDARVTYRVAKPSVSMTLVQGGVTVDAILSGGVMYVSGGVVATQPAGKRWARINVDERDPVSRAMRPLRIAMESAFVSPSEKTTGFEGVDAKVTAVDGEHVTYAVNLPAEKLRAAVRGGSIPGLDETALEQVPNGLSYQMTVDAKGLLVSGSMDLAGQPIQVEYSEWSTAATVAAPPQSEVGAAKAS